MLCWIRTLRVSPRVTRVEFLNSVLGVSSITCNIHPIVIRAKEQIGSFEAYCPNSFLKAS